MEEGEKISDNFRLSALKNYAPPRELWTPPDSALFSTKMIYNVQQNEAEQLRFKAIKYAFKHHYSNSFFYNRFCKDLKVIPDDIKTDRDYKKIPLISDIIFKDHPDAGKEFVEWLGKIFVGELPNIQTLKKRSSYDEVIDAFQLNDITLVYSSGTSGSFSFVPRDKITWNRQMYVCSSIFLMSPYDFSKKNSTIIWLGPNPVKTHLYIGRLTLTLTELFNNANIHFGIERKLTTKAIKLLMGTSEGGFEKLKSSIIRPFILKEENKIIERVIDIIDKSEKKGNEIAIGGTPFFVEMLMSKIEKKGLRFNIEKGMVITAGGWKAFSGFEIPGETFRNRANKIFGIPQENCRDIYGMVECNALNASCEGHYKHIPHSIVYPMALDEDSEPVGFGEYGRYAFLDPMANSYPGFIMTGDRVKILEKCPVCNKPGPVICEDISRLSGIQDRGCGAALARMFSEEVMKTKEKNE